MNLTPHFTLEELTRSQIAARRGINNHPTPAILANLKRLAKFLEQVRLLFDAPINISSGYRNEQVNELVGGAKNSQHLSGLAADFTIRGYTIDDIVRTIVDSNLQYDQVIAEYSAWVHISIPPLDTLRPRLQALIIDKSGTKVFV
jgi:hypothetical protein